MLQHLGNRFTRSPAPSDALTRRAISLPPTIPLPLRLTGIEAGLTCEKRYWRPMLLGPIHVAASRASRRGRRPFTPAPLCHSRCPLFRATGTISRPFAAQTLANTSCHLL